MRIHNLKFLRALGCDIPDKPEDVDIPAFMESVNPTPPSFGYGGLGGLAAPSGGALWAPDAPSGRKQAKRRPPERRIRNPYQQFDDPDEVVTRSPCPMHKDGGDCLRIRTSAETGSTYFECVYANCRFFGDPVALICAVKSVAVDVAIAMLRPGGALAHTLHEPMLDIEAAAYTESLVIQYHVIAYLNRCKQMLRLHPESSRLRAGLSCNTLNLVPADMGILVRDQDMPQEFKRLMKGKRPATYNVFPFTYNGVVTHIKVQDVDSTIAYDTATVTRADLGVYMEKFATVPPRLLVTTDPRAASILYGNLATESTRNPPVIAVSGFPLPERFAAVTALYLLSATNAPLDVALALSILGKPEAVVGAESPPSIHVWDAKRDVEQLTADVITLQLTSPKQSVNLDLWVLQQLDRLITAGDEALAATAIEAARLPDVIRLSLMNTVTVKGLSTKLAELLQAATTISQSSMLLGNGKPLRSGPTGLCGVSRKGGEVVLCNVGILVTQKIRSYDGSEVLVCKITAPDTSVASVDVGLPVSIWDKPNLIRAAIANAFAVRGQSPYLSFYSIAGYDWYDVLSKLSENCGFSREVAALGTDDAGDIQFPNLTVKPYYRTIDAQKQVYTLPTAVTDIYGGLTSVAVLGPREPFRRLLERCNEPAIAAFTCGIMHVIYQVTFCRYRLAAYRTQPGRHLFYVDTHNSAWHEVFQRLSSFFSDADSVPGLNYADPSTTLMEYSALGTLPLIATVPSIGGDKLASALCNTGMGLIGLLDAATAATAYGRTSAVFVVPPTGSNVADPFTQEEFDELRAAFPGFLLEYAANVKLPREYRVSHVPALAAYTECCKLLGVAEDPAFHSVAKTRFPDTGDTACGVDMLFDLLHHMLVTTTRTTTALRIVNEKYARGKDIADPHIVIQGGSVIVSHGVVKLVNSRSEHKFSVDAVTQELSERNMLRDPDKASGVTFDGERCWVVSRDLWESKVVKPAIRLPLEVTSGPTAQLTS